MSRSILRKDRKYTFSDYFELHCSTEEILAEFGYRYAFEELALPKASKEIPPLDRLRNAYIRKLPHIVLSSEAARREFYVSPFLLEMLDWIDAKIHVEYRLDGGENLSGAVDYFIKSSNNILIVDAKKGDLEQGFNQLAVALVALDKYDDSSSEVLYGAVTSGDFWRFGRLDREEKLLRRDMNGYVLPSNLDALFSILIGILKGKAE
uniref:Uncharacterized protein n=1 Tax=Candidatus Kentrum eta TaxID=2126337 RepID=A0A450UNJ4_9GAMM|nr:MAG: hypothetical protein BECKH772A_GA0070896_100664 [Candidatus Kentron sp. H]VFJ95423.1 MAG: hypothetical protein BECKH772B_GA0070898_100763 [Candidatus Kentron sp. H]VFK01514.1 MAG: hypothetical protein BECKH772C_GA0070978_100684 [Candidatus Kentron sp. H]